MKAEWLTPDLVRIAEASSAQSGGYIQINEDLVPDDAQIDQFFVSVGGIGG